MQATDLSLSAFSGSLNLLRYPAHALMARATMNNIIAAKSSEFSSFSASIVEQLGLKWRRCSTISIIRRPTMTPCCLRSTPTPTPTSTSEETSSFVCWPCCCSSPHPPTPAVETEWHGQGGKYMKPKEILNSVSLLLSQSSYLVLSLSCFLVLSSFIILYFFSHLLLRTGPFFLFLLLLSISFYFFHLIALSCPTYSFLCFFIFLYFSSFPCF